MKSLSQFAGKESFKNWNNFMCNYGLSLKNCNENEQLKSQLKKIAIVKLLLKKCRYTSGNCNFKEYSVYLSIQFIGVFIKWNQNIFVVFYLILYSSLISLKYIWELLLRRISKRKTKQLYVRCYLIDHQFSFNILKLKSSNFSVTG